MDPIQDWTLKERCLSCYVVSPLKVSDVTHASGTYSWTCTACSKVNVWNHTLHRLPLFIRDIARGQVKLPWYKRWWRAMSAPFRRQSMA